MAVVTNLAPLAPKGCPKAIAPPFGFTWAASSGKPNPRSTAKPCAAKASFNYITSILSRVKPALANTLLVAASGP